MTTEAVTPEAVTTDPAQAYTPAALQARSEEHTSELQSLV